MPNPTFVSQVMAALGRLRTFATAALPSTPPTGQLVYDTTTDGVKVANNAGVFTAVGGGGGGVTIGGAVVGGGANRVLFEDGSQNIATDANFTYAPSQLSIPAGSQAAPSLTFVGSGTNTGFYSRTANVLDIGVNNSTLVDLQATQWSMLNTMPIGWSVSPTGSAMNCGFARDADGVIRTTNGAAGVGWIQNGQGSSRVTTSDITNATATFAAITGITSTITSGRKYAGRLVIKCVDSVAAEGIQIDFNGGAATVSAFWAAAYQTVGGTVVAGTQISTALNGVINFTTITGETVIVIDISFVASSTGTFIPRQAQNTHATGTLTVRVGTCMLLEDIP